MTVVRVLKHAGGDAWDMVTPEPIEAANDRQAVRLATAGESAEARSGEFVVIPERSFRPIERSVKTEEVDKWA